MEDFEKEAELLLKAQRKMIRRFPQLKELHEFCQSIWWICDIHFPVVSRRYPTVANMVITGDGLVLCYLHFDHKTDTIKPIECTDMELSRVLQDHHIFCTQNVSLKDFMGAIEEFANEVNFRAQRDSARSEIPDGT